MDMLKNSTLLAIDDDVDILNLLNTLLVNKCKKIILEDNPQIGLKLAYEEQPDLILLDVVIKKVSGYTVCQQLKANTKTAHIPVIFLSSLDQAKDKVKGFTVGGVDYISKPFAIEEVIARIESSLIIHKKIFLSEKDKFLKTIEPYQLNDREIKILYLYISGHKRSEIAAEINLSDHAVKWYVKQLFEKFDVDNRAALIEKCKS